MTAINGSKQNTLKSTLLFFVSKRPVQTQKVREYEKRPQQTAAHLQQIERA